MPKDTENSVRNLCHFSVYDDELFKVSVEKPVMLRELPCRPAYIIPRSRLFALGATLARASSKSVKKKLTTELSWMTKIND